MPMTKHVKERGMICCCYLVTKSCLTLEISWTVACQVPLSMGFPRQEYWSGFSFPSAGDLPDTGTKPMSPALADRFFITDRQGSPRGMINDVHISLFIFISLLPTCACQHMCDNRHPKHRNCMGKN